MGAIQLSMDSAIGQEQSMGDGKLLPFEEECSKRGQQLKSLQEAATAVLVLSSDPSLMLYLGIAGGAAMKRGNDRLAEDIIDLCTALQGKNTNLQIQLDPDHNGTQS